MNYKVLYRKYRPQIFDDVVGQNTIINLLKDSIESNQISHAYIFSGPRGTGKTSTAKIFAKALNCQNRIDANPCCKCDACKNINISNDIYEIDAASNNGVDQIRDIIDNVKLTPINSKYKVYIIDEVHMLSTSAFNALLLTLEEPPSHSIFILATTNIEDVPITVLSRCQRLDFKKISEEDIVNNLKKVCELEKIDADEDALREIAIYADGGMRDALSILDQISKLKVKLTEENVVNNLGLVPNKTLNLLIDYLNSNDIDSIKNFIVEIKSTSPDYKNLVKRFIKIIKNRAIDNKINLISDRLTYDDYKKMIFELTDTLYKTNVNVNLYDLFELILVGYISSKNKNVETPTSQKDDKMEHNPVVQNELDISNSDDYYKKLEKVRINNCFVTATKSKKMENTTKWNEYINEVDSKKIKGLIEDTTLELSSDDIMVISSSIDSMVNNINSNLDNIEKSFNKKYNTNYHIIATSKNNWNIEIKNYKKNLENGQKYSMLEEPIKHDDIEDVLDIFAKEKIEKK